MLAPELLNVLCCPETHQDLRVAEPQVLTGLNAFIAAGTLKTRGGQVVSEKIEAGLVRSDGKFLYPIRHDIPVMLIDESIPLS